MASKPNAILLQPTWEFFKYCCVWAEWKIASSKEPGWFREHFDRGQYIEQEYGLPPRFPLIVALALDFSFAMTTKSLKRFRKKLDDERSRARKLRAGLLELRDFRNFTFMPLNDSFDKMMQAVDTFLEQPVKLGRKTAPWTHAVRLINEYVEECNPSLTRQERENLLTDLFDKVRARHGHRRRSFDCEPEETPRYRDLLKRLSQPPMRKIGQETR